MVSKVGDIDGIDRREGARCRTGLATASPLSSTSRKERKEVTPLHVKAKEAAQVR